MSIVQRLHHRTELDQEDPFEMIPKQKNYSLAIKAVFDCQLVRQVEALIRQNCGISIRQITCKIAGTSETPTQATTAMLVHGNLKYRSYSRQKGQFLSPKMTEKHVKVRNKLLNILKHPKKPDKVWYLSDKKNFCQQQKDNRRNIRWLARSLFKVPRVQEVKFLAHIMVFGVVSSQGNVMPSYFFKDSLKVNANVYIKF